jgi:hypothetical protein
MASPFFVGSSFTQNSSTSNSTVTVTYPGSASSGDLMILSVEFQRSSNGSFTIATPSGWTLIQTSDQSTSNARVFAQYWKIKAADTSVSVVASTGTTIYGNAQMSVWNGEIDFSNPIADYGVSFVSGSGLSLTMPSVNAATSQDMMVLNCHGESGSSSWSASGTPPAGFTEMVDNSVTSGSVNGSRPWMGSAYSSVTASGATGTKTYTMTGSFVTGINKFMASIAIRALPVSPHFIEATTTNNSTNSTSATTNYPSTSQSGDLLVMVANHSRFGGSGSFTVTTPSGWTLAATEDQSASGYLNNVYWRFRGAETSVTMVASASGYSNVHIAAYRENVDAVNPIVQAVCSFNSSSASTATAPAANTSVNNAAFLAYSCSSSIGYVNWVAPAIKQSETIGYSPGSGGSAFYAAKLTDNSTTPTTGIVTQYNGGYRFAWTITIQPAQSATVTPTDSATGTDTANVIAATSSTDTGAGSESAQVRVGATDTATRAETASVVANNPATDTRTSSESASVAANTPGVDTGAGADAASVVATTPGVDSGSGAETARVVVYSADTGVFTEVQAGIGQETGSFGENVAIIIYSSDAFTGIDTGFSANGVVNGDSETTTEQANVSVRATDTGTRTETAAVTASSPTADSGNGTESARVIVYASDGGAGTETSRITIPVSDSGNGAETQQLIVTIFATDGGTGGDATTATVYTVDAGSFAESAFRLISGLLVFPRQIKIQADNRRVIIDREPRRVSIDPDYRRTSIRAEERRHIVIPKDKRVFNIEGE